MPRLLLVLTTVPLMLNAFLDQSLGIRGVLRCSSLPLGNVNVKLFADRIPPFADLLIATNKTDSDGVFYLQGTVSEILPISPFLSIRRDCKGKGQRIQLPHSKQYVTYSSEVENINDIGIINLNLV